MSLNKGTVAMLVSPTIPPGIELVRMFSFFLVEKHAHFSHERKLSILQNTMQFCLLCMGRVMRKEPGQHVLSIFSFKLFCPFHSPNNMMEVIKVRKQQ